MTTNKWKSAGLPRRTVLGGMAAAGAAAFMPRRIHAQEQITLRWWSPQSSPEQLAAYETQIANFEALHENVSVVFERTSDEGYAPQLAAAFASGDVPNVVTHLPSFAVSNYWRNDLVEPFNDVIEMIGPDKFYEGVNRIYEIDDGQYAGTSIGNSAANVIWLRTDLMEQAGIDKNPRTWDELLSACQAMQGGGIYGAPLPYGRNSMTSLVFIGVIHQAGGMVFSPDLDVAIDSQETRDALEFYRAMREYCPPGATNYSWGESLTAFVSGATATGLYTGRVLTNVAAQNPSIADHITCDYYPTISEEVEPWTFNDFPSVFIPKDAQNMEATKQFAAFLFDPEGYIQQLHAAPGHVLPVLKTIAEDPAYLDNEIIEKYREEVDLMSEAAANGYNLGWESPEHQPNTRAGEVVNSGVIAEMVQRVVLNDENVDEVLGETASRIEEIMAG
ncbi:ABC transporter substrate-binding protein [Histidinibacterium aquaticum]|uniref:Carbohydrate ABC transporter substrate-binding protein n=1 Tax=Histidinibacterium aquaticum TaxID=2613962 RepID=A0A5J5GMG2_9RHOB|nr:ABC transporter substrate-binding protein [Histidinibacterium aquaticum]KAA9008808.1 carbohydrate ABC transporter substrate-binding protein [Histidinibacterium aquaticum]